MIEDESQTLWILVIFYTNPKQPTLTNLSVQLLQSYRARPWAVGNGQEEPGTSGCTEDYF